MSIPETLDLLTLRHAYADGRVTPEQVVEEALRRADEKRYPNVWIAKTSPERLQELVRALPPKPDGRLPLYGVPFAIKDNIDLAGVTTTAGCPDFVYLPVKSATVVERLIAAGALPI